MKNFIYNQLFTLKLLREKIERNEISPVGYILPGLVVLIGTVLGFIVMATDGTDPIIQRYRLIQDFMATAIAFLSIHIGFRQIDQPISWKKAGLALYATAWRMTLLGTFIYVSSLILGTIIVGSQLDTSATFVGTHELMSAEAALAGLMIILIPISIAYLFRNERPDSLNSN